MKKETFLRILKRLFLIFPEPPLEPESLQIYYEMLNGFEVNTLESAINEFIKKGHSFPLPSELLALIEG